jgi:hypothetical protein
MSPPHSAQTGYVPLSRGPIASSISRKGLDLISVRAELAAPARPAGLHVQGALGAVIEDLAVADGDDLALLGLLLGGVGMMIPPFTVSFSSMRRTSRRS